MEKRRNSFDIILEVYEFLKKNKNKEFSINRIFKEVKSKYEVVNRCLELLKNLDLIKERKGSKKPIPERFFSFKI
jgi:predicted transcriptional regulator